MAGLGSTVEKGAPEITSDKSVYQSYTAYAIEQNEQAWPNFS